MKRPPMEVTRKTGLTARDVAALASTGNPDALVYLATPDGLYIARHAALEAYNPGPHPVLVLQAVKPAKS